MSFSFTLCFSKLSSSILDLYNSDQGMTAANMGLSNTSCLSNYPVKREITGNIALRVWHTKKIV